MSVITKVIFEAMFVVMMCTSAHISKDMCLGRMNGFLYLDPNDCSGYVECRQGVVTMQQCPAGESFELSLYYCMASSHVECGTRSERTIVFPSTMLPDNSIPTLRPPTFPSIPIPPGVQHIMCRGMPEGIMLPNPDSCRSYIECRVGVRLDRKCNTGDLFDARVGFCLPYYAVDCGTRSDDETPPTRGPPIRPTTIAPPTPHTRPPIQVTRSTIQPTRVPPTRPVTNPPASDSQVCSGMVDGILLVNPKVCRSYYECQNNQVIDKECKEGEYFDTRVYLCLEDFVVDCGSRRVDGIVIMPQIPGGPTTDKSVHDVCSGAVDGTRLVDPNRCSNFFECQRNFRIERSCKSKEMFDLRLGMCLPAEHVDCGSRNQFPNQEVPELDIYPSCKSAGVYFLSHPLDCEAYFICANGVLIQHSCAPGVFFNSDISKCDMPHNTNCYIGGPSTNYPPIVVPQAPPLPNCKTGQHFFPSLANCAQYFICISGNPILMSCPRETLWNSRTMQCDSPNNVICAQRYNVLTESYE